MSIVKQAYYKALKAHEGQKRRNGLDYFENHVEKVYEAVIYDRFWLFPKPSHNYWLVDKEIFHCVLAASLLHDVLEDTKETVTEFPQLVQDLVGILTRNKNESYFDYIMKINDCGSITVAARGIKIADLTCNIQDLKEGSMKDKYRLAKYILSQGLHI